MKRPYQRFLEELSARLVVAGRMWTTPEDLMEMNVKDLLEQCYPNGVALTSYAEPQSEFD